MKIRRRRSDRTPRSTRFNGLAGFVTRWPWLVVGIWIFVVVLLAVIGAGVEKKLNAQVVYGDGTPAKRAHDLVVSQFGGEDVMVVMLRGPQSDVEDQGKALAKDFSHRPHTHVVSPWAAGTAIKGLTPKPGVAAIVVRVENREDSQILNHLAPVQRQVDKVVAEPVHASIAGLPALAESFRDANEKAALLGQIVAIPVLLIVLLFVFRSALAAFMPLIVGGAVVAGTRGLLSLLTGLLPIDLFAVGVAGMMGLALGVDYSLLVISRFREELERRDLAEAVQVTMTRTARSILPAGGGLVLAMLVTPMLLTGTIARSVSIAVITVTVLSMISAMCVVPALLTLLGPNLDRWSLPKRRGSQLASLRWTRSLAAHPRAVVSIMVAMLLCAALAFTMKTGVISVEQLPSGDSGRHQQEDVEAGLGPGWVAPMEVVVHGHDGPITTPHQLNALASFQREVEGDPGVVTVAGFGRVANKAKNLNSIEGNLVKQEKKIGKLAGGISKLHKGASASSTGLLAAAEGSKQLGAGIGATNTGAGVLAKALRAVSTGSGQLSEGLGRVDEGGDKLAEGASKASTGAGLLATGLEKAKEKTGEIAGSARLFKNAMLSGEGRLNELHGPLGATETQLATAWRALQRMTAGRSDPEYAAVLHAVEEASRRLSGKDPKTGEQADPSFDGVEAGIERAEGQFGVGLYLAGRLGTAGGQAQEGIAKLAQGSAQLNLGLRRLAAGSGALSGGLAQLSEGGQQLPPVLVKLRNGAERLEDGLGKLGAGAGQLATGLGGGAQKSKLLTGALQKIKTALNQQAGGKEGGSKLAQLREQSPGLFHSGYFVLAGLDGSHPKQREQLGFLINLDRGGQTARMLVIPDDKPTSTRTQETKDRLEADAEGLARKTGAEVVVGGAGPNQIELNKLLREEAPPLRLALALVSFVVLLLVVRSLILAILAALLNVITVSASFGVLALLFNNSVLGGPGFVDATVIPATVMIIFGLAIDYEVFIFARIREEYVRTGSSSAAIERGLDHTAPVVSGAAMIMIAVFLSFSVSDFMSFRNFGVAQAVAVFLDAFVVRLVVIPTLMRWLGRWCWWIPAWLDRLLPGGTSPATPGAPVTAAVEPEAAT